MLRTDVLYKSIISNMYSEVNTILEKNRTNFLNICLPFEKYCVTIKTESKETTRYKGADITETIAFTETEVYTAQYKSIN